MKVRINITKKDITTPITTGRRGQTCPMARACHRHKNHPFLASCGVSCESLYNYSISRITIPFTKAMYKFVDAFDTNKPVTPRSFILEVPDAI
jgi:hypothetical protein